MRAGSCKICPSVLAQVLQVFRESLSAGHRFWIEPESEFVGQIDRMRCCGNPLDPEQSPRRPRPSRRCCGRWFRLRSKHPRMTQNNQSSKQSNKPTIGWREWLVLPDLGIKFIKAKIDTGARSSSLHAVNIRLEERDGQRWAAFQVNPVQRRDDWVIDSAAPVIETRSIRSSSGETQLRPVIRTRIILQGLSYEIDLTLADRREMGFRMLLGREAFRRRFLIDPGRSYLGGVPKKRKS